MALAIREARDSDLPALLHLHAQLEKDGRPTMTPDQAAAILASIRSYPDYRIYVAEDERGIAGTFALLVMDNLAHGGARSGVVEDVVVEVSRRREGIGREMMLYALARCREKGCYKMSLSSNLAREEAHRFYEALGFEKHGYSFKVDID